jgi:hypothetical protein
MMKFIANFSFGLCTGFMLAVLFCASPDVAAQMSARKPGLWEIKTRTLVDGKIQERSLAYDRLEKQDQTKVQEVMAKRGMKLIKDGADGRTIQMCLSQQQAVKPPELFGSTMRKAGCLATEVGRKDGDKTALYEFVCTGDFPGNGRGEMTLESPQKYAGWTQVKQTEAGKPLRTIRNEVTAKWVKTDCGALTKP